MVSYKKLYDELLKKTKLEKDINKVEQKAKEILDAKVNKLTYELPLFFLNNEKLYSTSKVYYYIKNILPSKSSLTPILNSLTEKYRKYPNTILIDELTDISKLKLKIDKELEFMKLVKICKLLTNDFWVIYILEFDIDNETKNKDCQHKNLIAEFSRECNQYYTFNKDNILIEKNSIPEVFEEKFTDFYCKDCRKKFFKGFAEEVNFEFTLDEIINTPLDDLKDFQKFLENR